MILTLFIMVVCLAFFFGVVNGFIDGGGLVSTVITTRALEPFSALICVAVCEVLGLFLLGQVVSRTLGHLMVTFPLPQNGMPLGCQQKNWLHGSGMAPWGTFGRALW